MWTPTWFDDGYTDEIVAVSLAASTFETLSTQARLSRPCWWYFMQDVDAFTSQINGNWRKNVNCLSGPFHSVWRLPWDSFHISKSTVWGFFYDGLGMKVIFSFQRSFCNFKNCVAILLFPQTLTTATVGSRQGQSLYFLLWWYRLKSKTNVFFRRESNARTWQISWATHHCSLQLINWHQVTSQTLKNWVLKSLFNISIASLKILTYRFELYSYSKVLTSADSLPNVCWFTHVS